jgi:hypothetical protein
MANEIDIFTIPMAAAADYTLKQFYLVKQTAVDTATLCTVAGEKVIGVLQDTPAAAGEACSVRYAGKTKVMAGGIIAVDDDLTVDSSGRAVAVTGNAQYCWGRAAQAAAGSGVIIDAFMGMGGRGVSTGSVTTAGCIQLPLQSARETSTGAIPNIAGNGGLLAADTTPILTSINAATDPSMRVAWAASNNDPIMWSVVLPPDVDDTADMTFKCIAYSAGATDTPVLTIGAFFGIGDTNCGGNTTAISATPTTKSVTLGAVDVLPAPGPLSITLYTAAHTTDIVYVTAAWLEYTGK